MEDLDEEGISPPTTGRPSGIHRHAFVTDIGRQRRRRGREREAPVAGNQATGAGMALDSICQARGNQALPVGRPSARVNPPTALTAPVIQGSREQAATPVNPPRALAASTGPIKRRVRRSKLRRQPAAPGLRLGPTPGFADLVRTGIDHPADQQPAFHDLPAEPAESAMDSLPEPVATERNHARRRRVLGCWQPSRSSGLVSTSVRTVSTACFTASATASFSPRPNRRVSS